MFEEELVSTFNKLLENILNQKNILKIIKKSSSFRVKANPSFKWIEWRHNVRVPIMIVIHHHHRHHCHCHRHHQRPHYHLMMLMRMLQLLQCNDDDNDMNGIHPHKIVIQMQVVKVNAKLP